MKTLRAKLVHLLPGPFRHRHGEEMLYAWDQELGRVANAPPGRRRLHDTLLFWDFATTFFREWRVALSWELKTAPVIVAIVLGYQVAWHDWFRLGMAAVICGGWGASYLICKSGFTGSIRRKVGDGAGLAVLATVTTSAPYLLFPFIRRDDALQTMDTVGFALVSGLVLMHALRNGRWVDAGSRTPQKLAAKVWVASWGAVLISAGLPMVSVLRLHALHAFPSSPFWLLLGAGHYRKIWAETEPFRDLSTYVYPSGRR